MRSSDADVLVLELSSYQLRFLGEAAPDAGALLNIAPDHLDWHGSFEAYARAKAMIFERMASDAVLAFNVDDPVTVTTVARADCALVPCSGHHVPDGGNGVDRGDIVVNGHRFPAPIDDPSFLFDLVAAATVAFAVGGNVEGIGASIAAFSPGDHRRQQVSTTDGIRWIDDSKATNPHAAAAAVAAYAPVILLAGGRNKGLDLSPLGDLDGVEHLIAFGESGEAIASSTSGVSTLVRTLAEAVDAARSIAHPGDTVLLSPGCASFDEFDSYAQRGDVFQTLARQAGGTVV